jgi:ParB family chromosome partitioning protein
MTNHQQLDLSALNQFKASSLFEEGAKSSEPLAAVQVELAIIDFDPTQPRRQFREESLQELAESVRMHGILEPVSLRRHPDAEGRYMVNRGERRVRAARECGLTTVPAFVDDRIDPFAQAVENLHREDMSPWDLASFVAEREKEGLTKTEIARRLSKRKSLISEVATLNFAPPALIEAVKAGHVGEDTRVLYRLVSVGREQPEVLEAVLAHPTPISRGNFEQVIKAAQAGGEADDASQSAPRSAQRSAGRTVLIVEHNGRRGALRWKASDDSMAEVRFGEGPRVKLPLSELKAVCWATEEGA